MDVTSLINHKRFTVFLGKNGSGKSTLLRSVDNSGDFETKYITPERGGVLRYDAGIDNNVSNSPEWLANNRRSNRFEQFRQASVSQYRTLQLLILYEIESNTDGKREDLSYTFDSIIDQINQLLPKIEICRTQSGFSFSNKDGTEVKNEDISSGESELVSLAIETLVFSKLSSMKTKAFLLDEPDVHLHPDLQQKFVRFVEKVAEEGDFKVAIATHSTAITGAFENKDQVQIVPIKDVGQTEFQPFEIDETIQTILPVFGIHPLSEHFNKTPVLLIEGEDDKRVFEQIVRSSNGRFSFSPCPVGDVNELHKWEVWLNDVLPAIYDEPLAYSFRDLDTKGSTKIDDYGCVRRVRLNCYEIENILLCDECFERHHMKPDEFVSKLSKWAEANQDHKYSSVASSLCDDFSTRRTMKFKKIRNIILAILDSTAPWEVIVGKLIATKVDQPGSGENSLRNYLGEQVIDKLFNVST